MATRSLALLAPPALRVHPLRRLLSVVAMRRSRGRLAELDDHLLRDIGLTRGQAAAESERASWDAPDHWLR
jgi:uncharacterized protein YjiS (DUF1127 family)